MPFGKVASGGRADVFSAHAAFSSALEKEFNTLRQRIRDAGGPGRFENSMTRQEATDSFDIIEHGLAKSVSGTFYCRFSVIASAATGGANQETYVETWSRHYATKLFWDAEK